MSQFSEALLRETSAFVSLSQEQVEALEQHYDLLIRWNRKLNLTAIRTLEDAVRLHYAESLFLGLQISRINAWAAVQRIVDVGSGAGFPGFPISVLYPDRTVELVESHQRKAVFLREVARSRDNLVVSPVRFGDLAGPWDVLVSRAVAWDDIAERAIEVAGTIALLVGSEDVASIAGFDSRLAWRQPTPLPWPTRGGVLIGNVPRGTSA